MFTGEAEDAVSDSESSGTNPRLQLTATGAKKPHSSADELRWDHKVNLIGRPIKDPLLHICEVCSLPILIYGRMVRGGRWMGGGGDRNRGRSYSACAVDTPYTVVVTCE